ncbi:hypothetical protein OW763_12855 [Clostridium aestuarii]|uniref:Uncharacterized protein n=1 Tax=Clostridium aestuarii TaxID=338193 RepID=A0ABT4D1X3_9CLOT|nr:hypothetical protein [Clostridium aestuarii]MCY6485229.1 hypothetical protein [Clostridium aestuarii]
MKLFIWLLIIISVIIVFVVITKNPMDDSGEEFNANIFPFEIKDPKDWYKSKENEKEKDKE